MLNVIGYVTKQADAHYTDQLGVVSVKAEIDTISKLRKTADSQPDFRVVTETDEIGASWTCKSETSKNEYVNLSFAASEFGPKQPFANLHGASGSDEANIFAAFRNIGD
jgi:uncharacterized protein (DUF736 family)